MCGYQVVHRADLELMVRARARLDVDEREVDVREHVALGEREVYLPLRKCCVSTGW